MKGGKIMLNFFKKVHQARQDNKTFNKAMEYKKSGKSQEALDICLDLLKRKPYNVDIRRATLLLQERLGLEIDLPKANIKPSADV